MDQKILVDRDIEEGRRLVLALDAAQFPVVAALWYLAEEGDSWVLLIASPKVREEGPLGAYDEILQLIGAEGIGLLLRRISAVADDDPVITEFRIFAGTPGAPYLGSADFSRTVLGDLFVQGAYVYRAERFTELTGSRDIFVVVRDRQARQWRAHSGTMQFKDGFLDDLRVSGYDWPHSRGKFGVNVRLDLLQHVHSTDALPRGDVSRWTFTNGRLRSVETLATGVEIEGLPVARTAP